MTFGLGREIAETISKTMLRQHVAQDIASLAMVGVIAVLRSKSRVLLLCPMGELRIGVLCLRSLNLIPLANDGVDGF
jgi:hypothetical protein